jgi:hypothetical protein
MFGNARFTEPKGRTLALAVPVAVVPLGVVTVPLRDVGPRFTPSAVTGKLMLTFSKSKALAVSWLNALVDPFCTITGKPNEVATRLAYTGRAQIAVAKANIAIHPRNLVFMYYPPLKRSFTFGG